MSLVAAFADAISVVEVAVVGMPASVVSALAVVFDLVISAVPVVVVFVVARQ